MGIFSNIITVIAVSLGIAILLFMAYYFIKNRRDQDPFEDMEGEEFEKYCADLLANRGFYDIENTTASHDFGIDILGTYQGITYAIQCKCYSEPVGIKAVQEAYAGKDFYDCMIAVVMTNQRFTKNAKIFADKLHVLLWDGEYIENLMKRYGESSYLGEATGIHEQRKYARRKKKENANKELFAYESLDDITNIENIENSNLEDNNINNTELQMEGKDENLQ